MKIIQSVIISISFQYGIICVEKVLSKCSDEYKPYYDELVAEYAKIKNDKKNAQEENKKREEEKDKINI